MTILAKMQKRYEEKFDPLSVSVPVSEVGRHCKPKVPREERLCKVCVQNEIEDEIHLLFHFTKYEYIGKQFIAKQSQILNLTSFDDYKKLCYILFTTSNKTSIHCTAKYISKCLLLRNK